MLRAIRRSRDITQQTLADMIGVDRSTLAKWERNKIKLPEKHLERLAAILGCSKDDLLRKDGEPNGTRT